MEENGKKGSGNSMRMFCFKKEHNDEKQSNGPLSNGKKGSGNSVRMFHCKKEPNDEKQSNGALSSKHTCPESDTDDRGKAKDDVRTIPKNKRLTPRRTEDAEQRLNKEYNTRLPTNAKEMLKKM